MFFPAIALQTIAMALPERAWKWLRREQRKADLAAWENKKPDYFLLQHSVDFAKQENQLNWS